MQTRFISATLALSFIAGPVAASAAHAQSTAAARATADRNDRPTGWELSGIPAVNFNSDEGFGYGLIVHAFNYGDGTARPYRYTVQPQAFLTTLGRRDVSVFFDAPHLLPFDWRVSGYLGREQQLATPYYGFGNDTPRDERLELPPNPHFYRYGRVGVRMSADFQHKVRGPLRLLLGASTRSWNIDDTPFDSGTTLLAQQLSGSAAVTGRTNSARVGLVYDTRDREMGPTRGQWIETLVQRAGGEQNGVNVAFTRVTTTARVYAPLHPRLVWAQRVVAQYASNSTPFYERFVIQGSFRDDEGLGGSTTVRGLPKNRYAGNRIALLNEEFRWTASEFLLRKRPSAIVLTAFTDYGRVWDTTAADTGHEGQLHVGGGMGVRLRHGENFVVAVDVGHSRQATAPVYIGLGYLF